MLRGGTQRAYVYVMQKSGGTSVRVLPGDTAPISRAHRERHLRGYRAEVVAWIALIAAIVGFAVLAMLARSTPYFWFDVPLTRAIQSVDWPPLRLFLEGISWLGLPPESNIIFGALIVGLALLGKRWEAAGLLMAALGSICLWYLV